MRGHIADTAVRIGETFERAGGAVVCLFEREEHQLVGVEVDLEDFLDSDVTADPEVKANKLG